MLVVNQLNGFGAQTYLVEVVHVHEHYDSGSSSPSTGSIAAFTGNYDALIIIAQGRGESTGRTVSSVTVDGAAASSTSANVITVRDRVHIWAKVHSAKTPNVQVNWSGAMANSNIVVIAVNNLISITPIAVATDTSNPLDIDVNTNAGGIIVVGASNRNSSGATYTGVDTTDISGSGEWLYYGYSLTPSAETPKDLRINLTLAATEAGCAASFR